MFSRTLSRPLAALAFLSALGACTTGSNGSTATTQAAAASGLTAVAAPAPGSFALDQATYSVAQSAGALTVTVSRTSGQSGVVSVAYATADGTATAGTDYTAAGGTLTWQDGDTAPQTFTVTLNNAAAFAGSRSFAITLSDPTGGAFLGSPSTATATITGSGSAGGPGTLAWSATAYSVAQAAGSLTVTATRVGGSSGAVSVSYATANGTASSGADYTATSGKLNWANGDASAKTISIPVSNAAPFSGTRTFTIALSAASGGASLGSPATVNATISGSATSSPGTLALSASTFGVSQSGGSLTVTAVRTSGSIGAVTVAYATADGTAKAGTDYSAASGTLSWAAGDTAAKTFSVKIATIAAYSGTRTFAVTLSSAGGGAALGSPSSATATISGSVTPACSQNSGSYTTTNAFDAKQFGNYLVNNNNWGGTSGQVLFANSQSCWGVTTTATTDRFGIGSYPSVTRGWTQNATYLGPLSTPGTYDWTTKSGMGIAVTALTKARVHWAFTAPPSPNRWSALMDIYFHKTNAPNPSMFYPQLDLMVEPSIADQLNSNGSTYYGTVITGNRGTQVTIGGNTYSVYVDNPSQVFNQPGGHTIEMFMTPNSVTNPGQTIWGSNDSVTDVAAIIKFWMQTNPKDDKGNVIVNSAGNPVGQVITPDLFLNVINAGFEIDDGTAFTTTAFCVAMQNEPDCN